MSLTTTPVPIRLAQTVGLTTSLLLGGANLTASILVVPSLLLAPASLLVRQWAGFFHRGKATAPPLALLSALAYGYLAYEARREGDQSKMWRYVTAGVLAVGIVPYTLLVMQGTNNVLLEKMEEVGKLGRGEELKEVGVRAGRSAHELVDWWGVLNVGRGLISMGAGLLGVWTALI